MMIKTSNPSQVVFIGIAGPSGCGKTSYAKHLSDRLHSPLYPIGLDHFFIRSIPIDHPILGRVHSEEEPETLAVDKFLLLLNQIKQNPQQSTRYHRKDVSIDNNKPIIIIVEGFLLFALSDQLTDLFDIRIFFESTQTQCRMRRYRRDYRIDNTLPNDAVIIPNKFQQWFDHLVWTEYLKRRDSQILKSEQLFHSDIYDHHQYEQLDDYINQRLNTLIK